MWNIKNQKFPQIWTNLILWETKPQYTQQYAAMLSSLVLWSWEEMKYEAINWGGCAGISNYYQPATQLSIRAWPNGALYQYANKLLIKMMILGNIIKHKLTHHSQSSNINCFPFNCNWLAGWYYYYYQQQMILIW